MRLFTTKKEAFYEEENGVLQGRTRRFVTKNSTVSYSAINALITKHQSLDNGSSTLWCFMLQEWQEKFDLLPHHFTETE